MDLNFVTGKSESLLKSFEEFGCDLDSLLYVTKDFFAFCDELEMNPRQSAEFFIKLKNAHDRMTGKPRAADLVVYENHRINPTRLCLENRSSGSSIFFTAILSQSKVDKKDVFYYCDSCKENVKVKRSEVQTHYLSTHS